MNDLLGEERAGCFSGCLLMCPRFAVSHLGARGVLQSLIVALTGDMSHLMTKPTKWHCAQRRLRSAWAFAQSYQSLCYALNG